MRTKHKFVDSVTKFLPVFHGKYREMCSLAAVGQLGGPQMCELNQHIASCDSCRKFLESVARASVQVLPVLAENRISSSSVAPPVGIRSRFLARLNTEPIRLDARTDRRRLEVFGHHENENDTQERAHVQETVDPVEELMFQRVDPREVVESSQPLSARVGVRLWPIAAAVAASALLGAGGYYIGHRNVAATPASVSKQTSPVVRGPAQTVSSNDPGRVSVLEREKATLQTQLGALKEQLSASDVQQKELSEKLADANTKLASVIAQQARSGRTGNREQVTGDSKSDTIKNQEQEMQVALLQKDVARLRTEFGESILRITAQQRENDDLRSKIQTTEANLQEQLNFKDAKSQMGDLVAARNLHIVDVYDAGPEGKRQRAFGRVFYTEGKSLVFYAYDLQDAGQLKANVVFHVWGGKAGVKEVTHSLGILRKDDDGQARWALTFDDPKVLGQINSVFVTAESANKHYNEPHGKKVLFAYFGSSPNHP